MRSLVKASPAMQRTVFMASASHMKTVQLHCFRFSDAIRLIVYASVQTGG
jgi:hypothetical protein